MTTVLFISLILLAYTLAGYPLVMSVLARLRPRPVSRSGDPVPLSVVLCGKNEGARMAERLENLLAMDYPSELLEIIVVSDGSTDDTGDVVRRFADQNVCLVEYPESRGKAYALNRGIEAASNPFLLLCDARQTFSRDAARRLVAYFADDAVGAVSGRLVIRPMAGEASAKGLGAYWDIEVRLRRDEGITGSVVGVTGAIYALRKSCFSPLPEGTVLDDVLIPMRTVLGGGRVVFEPEAVAVDEKNVDKLGELNRKIRTLYGNLQLFDLERRLFIPFANPIWWRFISHKILRLFLPLFFAVACLSALLSDGWVWFGMLQLLGWLTAFVSWRYCIDWKPFRILATLYLLNLAIIKAWRCYLSGGANVWTVASSNFRAED